jgi:hypothetical protein
MSVGELVICKCEDRIALNCLIQQANGLEQDLSFSRNKSSTRDERFGSYVEIVSSKISRWFLLDGRFLFGRKRGFKLRNNLFRKLALNREYIGEVPIVRLSPELHI